MFPPRFVPREGCSHADTQTDRISVRCRRCLHCTLFVYSVSPVAPQLATWDSVHGLNGSLKESRIENGMQGVTVKVVTLLVSGRCHGHNQSICIPVRKESSD